MIWGLIGGQQHIQLKIRNLLVKNKGKMNIEERKEVPGTRKYLLFFASPFESKDIFPDASEQRT